MYPNILSKFNLTDIWQNIKPRLITLIYLFHLFFTIPLHSNIEAANSAKHNIYVTANIFAHGCRLI